MQEEIEARPVPLLHEELEAIEASLQQEDNFELEEDNVVDQNWSLDCEETCAPAWRFVRDLALDFKRRFLNERRLRRSNRKEVILLKREVATLEHKIDSTRRTRRQKTEVVGSPGPCFVL